MSRELTWALAGAATILVLFGVTVLSTVSARDDIEVELERSVAEARIGPARNATEVGCTRSKYRRYSCEVEFSRGPLSVLNVRFIDEFCWRGRPADTGSAPRADVAGCVDTSD